MMYDEGVYMATVNVVLSSGETKTFEMRDNFREGRAKVERGEGVIRVRDGNAEGALYLKNALVVFVSE